MKTSVKLGLRALQALIMVQAVPMQHSIHCLVARTPGRAMCVTETYQCLTSFRHEQECAVFHCAGAMAQRHLAGSSWTGPTVNGTRLSF